MSLHVGFRCNQAPSGAVKSRLGKIAKVSDCNIDFIVDSLGAWKDIFQVAAQNGIRRISPLNIADDPPDWKSPEDEWIGAVLDYDMLVIGQNPKADYEPPLPVPERGGYIPFTKPII